MWPYTKIAFSVNGFVSLTGFRSFTTLPMRHIIQSTIEITALKNGMSEDDYCKYVYHMSHPIIEHPDGSGDEFGDPLYYETRHWR
jgi:hypothetical protein